MSDDGVLGWREPVLVGPQAHTPNGDNGCVRGYAYELQLEHACGAVEPRHVLEGYFQEDGGGHSGYASNGENITEIPLGPWRVAWLTVRLELSLRQRIASVRNNM